MAVSRSVGKGQRTTIVETLDCTFKEVRSTFNEREANELLKTGQWRLLHGCVAHADNAGYCAKPCYILGKFE